MSLLDKVEDWIVKKTLTPLPVGAPPSDDGMLTLIALVGFLLVTAITCGHCLAR
jgi:hypothetical protein